MADLRARGLACDTDYAGRSLKGQLTQAGRTGAPTVVIARETEAVLRRAGAEDLLVRYDDLPATLTAS